MLHASWYMLPFFGHSMLSNIVATSIIGLITSGCVTMSYLFRNYPKFRISELASNDVAALKGCRIKNKNKITAQFQIFYPCSHVNHDEANGNTQNNLYMRSNAVEGLCRTLGGNTLVRYFLSSILNNKSATHLRDGSARNVNVLNASSKHQAGCKLEGWPVVLFSHGLFGSMEEYSTICREVASHGFIVIAPEHEDGSASYAEKAANSDSADECDRNLHSPQSKIDIVFAADVMDSNCVPYDEKKFEEVAIPYTKPNGVVYADKQSVVDFRKPFLKKRCQEMMDLVAALAQYASDGDKRISSGNEDEAAESSIELKKKFQQILSASNLKKDGSSNSIILAGHSFGASTVLYMAHQWESQKQKNEIENFLNAKSLLLLDTWVSPVPNDILLSKLSIPTLCVFCQDLVTWTAKRTPHELDGVAKMLEANMGLHEQQHTTNSTMFCMQAIRETKHQFFSDAPYWIPAFVASYAGVTGKTSIGVSRTCLEKLIMPFLLESGTPACFGLTTEEKKYVYNVNEAMLRPPN